jgi:cytidylate kinase
MQKGLFNDADGTIDSTQLQALMPQIKITFAQNEATGRPDTYLNGQLVEQQIRSMDVSSRVSTVAALAFVREAMVAQQQAMGAKGGVVMDGRDIGTLVFPNAELKIFVTASAEVRAQRRYKELTARGDKVDFQTILDNVQQRDYIDTHREVTPLRKADDALELDNSNLTIAQQKQWLMEKVEEVTK